VLELLLEDELLLEVDEDDFEDELLLALLEKLTPSITNSELKPKLSVVL
jgi:hypothetical protein